MQYDFMYETDKRLKELENKVTSNENTVTINIINRQGKIAHKLNFKLTTPIKKL